MPACVVKLCKNHCKSKQKSHGITYHTFPTNSNTKRKWVAAIRKSRNDPEWEPLKSSVVCSDHFEANDLYFTESGLRRVKSNGFPKKIDNENLVNNKKETVHHYGHNNIDEVTEEPQAMSSSIQFSVKVEVEKCDGSDTTSRDGDVYEGSNYAGSFSMEESGVNAKLFTGDDDEIEEKYFIRKVLPHSVKNVFVPVKQYTLTKNIIRNAIELQSLQNTEQYDKYLDIAIRNFYGEFKETTKLFHDQLIYEAIERWKDWYEVCPGFRDSPLLYICYICSKGWWRLQPFRDHIEAHNESTLKINTEPSHHEFFVAAYADQPLKAKKIDVDSNCWKCGKDAKYHAVSKRILKYECVGCDSEFMTCTKLAQHEGVCKQYIKKKCTELSVATNEYTTCPVCFRNYVSRREMDVHMIEYHSVRSDEPVLIQVKWCNTCNGCFYVYKYHDCSKKNKNVRCNNCCRKFTTKIFQHMHMQSNKGLFHCTVCSKTVKECMAMEHLVQHSKNYALLQWCVKCKDNVMYAKTTYFKNHMKLHGRWIDRQRWSAKVLLPTKCLKGEIVKCETILNIPQGDLNYFMSGITIPDKTVVDITRDNPTKNEEQDIILLDDDVEQPLSISEGPKMQEVESDNYALQAQLDAEILRDVEMEAAISKVFKASNSYQKLLEKETEELSEEDLYEDDLIILDDRNEVTVISDSDYEEPTVKEEIEEIVENNVEVKKELTEIEDSNLNQETVVKEEPETSDEDEKPVRRSAKEKRAELLLQGYMNIKQDTELKGVKDESDENYEENDSSSSEKPANMYECQKCIYRGTLFHFFEHVTKCCTASFNCSKCSTPFSTLKLYIRHLTQHNYKSPTCPECQDNFQYNSILSTHLKTHLRQLFVKVPLVQDVPVTSLTEKNTFQCTKCNTNVESEQFFNHWESHLMMNSVEETVEEDNSSDHSDDEERKESMNPKLIKDVLDLLLIRGKRKILKCNVCFKQFSRRNECKRHLIEHLLCEALICKMYTGNQLRCQLCKADNPTISKYKQHMREHAWLPLYKCDLCSKCFSDSSNYSKHRKVHNLFSFICDLCGGKFNAKGSLVKHLKMHETGPAACQNCDMTFYNESKLKKHYKAKHMCKNYTYPCAICRKRFASLKDKWDHLWLKHKQRKVVADCPLCKKSYRKMSDVKNHMRDEHMVDFTQFYSQLYRLQNP